MANVNIPTQPVRWLYEHFPRTPKYEPSINSIFLDKDEPCSRISIKDLLSFKLQTVSAYLGNGTKAFPHNNERLHSRNIHQAIRGLHFMNHFPSSIQLQE